MLIKSNGAIVRISSLPNGDFGIREEDGSIIVGAKTKEISITKTEILEDNTIVIYYSDNSCRVMISTRSDMLVRNSDRLVIKNNRLIVGKEEDIYSKILYAKDLNFTVDIDKNKPIEVQAKIRYSAKEGTAVLYPEENGIARVEFNEPQRAITRGQSVVFYIDDVVIGGGKII